MTFKKSLIILILFSGMCLFAQTDQPKREMRGIWMASLGIDWPRTTGTSAAAIQAQKNELISMLNSHKVNGMNAIFFHIRPLCDAVYKSSVEPWSRYLTGQQGAAPSDPSYDPLTFAVQEAHKRAMELHAWLNPYRALASGGSTSSLAANHVINVHPEWIIKCNGSEYRFLDPGLPAVRAYVTNIIVDILKRYDVDGIHFDDYFYPYTDYGTFNDDATFAKYSNGFTNRAKWRENNVHLLLKMIDDSVKYYKPWVKFGVSPAGSNSVNSTIYVNTDPWLQGTYTDTLGVAKKVNPYIDYILPQLYSAGINNTLPAWSGTSYLNGRQVYVGHGAYLYGGSSYPVTECGTQINISRTSNSSGSVYFSSQSVLTNIAGCSDTMRHNYYSNFALVPQMSWLPGSNKKPNAPSNLRIELNASTGKYELKWDKPALAADGDSAFFYLVYRAESSNIALDNARNIFNTTCETILPPTFSKFSATKGNYYTVTCVDRYGNESGKSNVLQFDPSPATPDKPVLLAPANGDQGQSSAALLKWRKSAKAESYSVQVSTDPNFASNILMNYVEMTDTTCYFRGVAGGTKYYWRIKAHSYGESQYSDVYTFEAGYPSAPVLAYPAHASTNVSLNPVFWWYKNAKAATYRFMLATSSTFSPSTTVVKDTIMVDTTLRVYGLSLNKMYFWRVKAINSYGESDWPTNFGFRTTNNPDAVEKEGVINDYSLMQNYPNPFNPSTQISYSLPKASFVTIKIYDILGNEIETLVNQEKPAGLYTVSFPQRAQGLTSGVYFCKITAGNFIQMRKMMLLK